MEARDVVPAERWCGQKGTAYVHRSVVQPQVGRACRSPFPFFNTTRIRPGSHLREPFGAIRGCSNLPVCLMYFIGSTSSFGSQHSDCKSRSPMCRSGYFFLTNSEVDIDVLYVLDFSL
jgi:hypothetical protein